jgi:HK97 family phage prohead protease
MTTASTKLGHMRIKGVGPDNGLGEMQFTGYASVFDNLDSAGDVVRKGAFATTLSEWEASEEVIPVYWGHDLSDPEANIGHAIEASEDDHGLRVKVQLDAESSKAQTVYRLLKGRRVGDMSYSYAVTEGAYVEAKADGDNVDGGFYEILGCRLFEVSVVPVGANPEAEILDVKNALILAKEGKVVSAKNLDALRSARDIISGVITAAESSSDTGKASASGPVKVEEPQRAKAEEPSRGASVTRVVDGPYPSTNAALSALALLDVERVLVAPCPH